MPKNRFLSLTAQSCYVALTGIALVFKPNMLIELFGFEPAHEIWIQVLGILVFSLAIIYMNITKENRQVAMATVLSRLFIAAGFGLLVVLGNAKPALMLFAGVDVLTAVWTWRELQNK
jgi:FtsH-binding integral membrane protein